MSIAGHTFDLSGRCVTLKDGIPCGRRWIDIMHCDATCVNMPNIAHYGILNLNEAMEIVAEARRVGDLAMEAIRGVASGIARGVPNPIEVVEAIE